MCWDNAVAESFWESLKRECIQGRVFATRADARRAIFRWINWYNTTRLHTSLNEHPTHRVGTAVPSSVITTRPADGEMANRDPTTTLRHYSHAVALNDEDIADNFDQLLNDRP